SKCLAPNRHDERLGRGRASHGHQPSWVVPIDMAPEAWGRNLGLEELLRQKSALALPGSALPITALLTAALLPSTLLLPHLLLALHLQDDLVDPQFVGDARKVVGLKSLPIDPFKRLPAQLDPRHRNVFERVPPDIPKRIAPRFHRDAR